MYSLEQVKTGVVSYIDTEFVNKIDGWKKWALVAAVAMYDQQAVGLFNKYKTKLQAMQLVDDEDAIDVDKMYEFMKLSAKKSGAITENVPILGAVTFTDKDIDTLYAFIKST